MIGQTIVEEAKRRGLKLTKPVQLAEVPGEGIEGYVDERKVAVGGWGFIAEKVKSATRPGPKDKSIVTAYVAIDGTLAGTIVMADPVRKDAALVIADLRRLGVKRLTSRLATGAKSPALLVLLFVLIRSALSLRRLGKSKQWRPREPTGAS